MQIDANGKQVESKILRIERIDPLRNKVMCGKISRLNENDAVVNGEIYVNIREACQNGYIPCLKDEVVVQAIESEQHSFSWRAISVTPIDKTARISCRETSANHIDSALVENKNGIIITENTDLGVLQKGERKEFFVEVQNNGDRRQLLLNGKFHGRRCDSQLCVLSPAMERPIAIHPGQSVTFHFSCKAKFIGKTSELYVFTFKSFKIGRYFNMDIEDTTFISHIPAGKWNQSRNTQPLTLEQYIKPNGVLVPGVRPIKPNPFFRLAMYTVPEKLWKVILGNESESNKGKSMEMVKCSLRSLYPCLFQELNISNYCDKLHALLYLEEIEMTIRMRSYDMVRVNFGRIGGEYLSLEVPGLAEKRPSLLVGDRIIATFPWEDPNNPGKDADPFFLSLSC